MIAVDTHLLKSAFEELYFMLQLFDCLFKLIANFILFLYCHKIARGYLLQILIFQFDFCAFPMTVLVLSNLALQCIIFNL